MGIGTIGGEINLRREERKWLNDVNAWRKKTAPFGLGKDLKSTKKVSKRGGRESTGSLCVYEPTLIRILVV